MRKWCEMLTQAITHMDPDVRAAVLLPNSDRSALEHVFSVHLPPTFVETIKGSPINELPIGTCGTAIYAGSPVSCGDIEGSEQWSSMWRTLCLAHGIRACHSQPVFGQDGTAIASFSLYLEEKREPTDRERRIAEFGAHITGIMIERSRAEEALRERNHQLDLLARTAQQLLTGQEPERDVLQRLFGDIAQLIGMEMFYHYRPCEQPRELRLHTSGGITEKERTLFATVGFGELLCGRVAEWRTRVLIEDLQHSPHPGSEVLRAAGVTSYAGFPLEANGELVGTLAFVSHRRAYLREGDVQMVSLIC